MRLLFSTSRTLSRSKYTILTPGKDQVMRKPKDVTVVDIRPVGGEISVKVDGKQASPAHAEQIIEQQFRLTLGCCPNDGEQLQATSRPDMRRCPKCGFCEFREPEKAAPEEPGERSTE
jgi:NADH pyrophosphatase NudC (nudix superfamily)